MKIIIKNRSEILNEMTFEQWVQSCGDDEAVALMEGDKDIETSVQDWNLNNRCKGSTIEAVIQ